MKSFSFLLEKLHEWFDDQSFSIWFQFSRDRHFRPFYSSSHGDATTIPPQTSLPIASNYTTLTRYCYETIGSQQMYRFFYEDEGQALLFLPHKDERQITLTPDQCDMLWIGIRLLLAEEVISAKAEESKKLFEGIRSYLLPSTSIKSSGKSSVTPCPLSRQQTQDFCTCMTQPSIA